MSALAPHIQRQIERYADNALNRADVDTVEALLESNAPARAYLQSIEQVRLMPQFAVEAHSNGVDFDQLEDAIMRAVQDSAQETAQEDPYAQTLNANALVAQWVDNELTDPNAHQKVFSHLAENQAARDAVEGMREIGHATRAYAETKDAEIDFAALEAKCLAPFENVSTPSNLDDNVTPLQTWYRRFKTPLAAAAGIAAATAILLPLSFGALGGSDQSQFTRIDAMNVDAGYSGTITRGTRKSAPVVWISDDPDAASQDISKEPIHPVHEEDADDASDAP